MSDRSNLRGLRILVVEDTVLIADLIVDQLEEAGCSIVGPASHVAQGLALAAAEPIDGALLDVNLNGEFCFPIAKVLVERGIPIAFLTGYGDAVLAEEYQNAPRLSKPFDLDELVDLMKAHFARAA